MKSVAYAAVVIAVGLLAWNVPAAQGGGCGGCSKDKAAAGAPSSQPAVKTVAAVDGAGACAKAAKAEGGTCAKEAKTVAAKDGAACSKTAKTVAAKEGGCCGKAAKTVAAKEGAACDKTAKTVAAADGSGSACEKKVEKAKLAAAE